MNATLGQFHGLLQTLVLLSENRALDQSETVSILDAVCQEFAEARTEADFTQATVAILAPSGAGLALAAPPRQDRFVIFHKGPWQPPEDPGAPTDRHRQPIDGGPGGDSKRVEFESGGRMAAIDAGSINRRRIEEVLRVQRVPSLTGLMALYDAAMAVRRSGDKAVLDTFKRTLGELHALEQQLENQLTEAQQGTHPFCSEAGPRSGCAN